MPLREFTDAGGVSWRAWDTRPGERSIGAFALPEALREGWLSFESEHEKRRCAPIPEDWEFLSTEALCRVLASAVPVRRSAEQASARPPPPPTAR